MAAASTVRVYMPLILGIPAQFYVAPNGTPQGDGSLVRPWDLATALAQPPVVEPGAIIWLRGGTYNGPFQSTLRGVAGQPITVRQYPGERAIIDNNSVTSSVSLDVQGAWVVFWGFEVTNSNPKRITTQSGSAPTDLVRAIGIDVYGPHMKLINLIIHDAGTGIGLWDSAQDSEVYGSLIYNNGWQGSDRSHGHGIYMQNSVGIQHILDNIVFNQFGYGLHAYGLANESLRGFDIEGNAVFGNGSLSRKGQEPNILVGGDTPAANVTLSNNYTYHSGLASQNVDLAYGTTANQDVTVQNNYIVGGDPVLMARQWNQIAMTGNTLVGDQTVVAFQLPNGISPAGYQWNNNSYSTAANIQHPFSYRFQGFDFAGWKGATSLDSSSEQVSAHPSSAQVFVRPNVYEPGRANIIVYNWPLASSVNVDLTGVLPVGASYTIRNVQNYAGPSIATGVYRGGQIALPLSAVTPSAPVGNVPSAAPSTGTLFNVYVVTSP
jgi:hypothetical protein